MQMKWQNAKRKLPLWKKQNELLHNENVELREIVKEQNKYRMRWCLQIKGISEVKWDNVRPYVIGTREDCSGPSREDGRCSQCL